MLCNRLRLSRAIDIPKAARKESLTALQKKIRRNFPIFKKMGLQIRDYTRTTELSGATYLLFQDSRRQTPFSCIEENVLPPLCLVSTGLLNGGQWLEHDWLERRIVCHSTIRLLDATSIGDCTIIFIQSNSSPYLLFKKRNSRFRTVKPFANSHL